MPLSIEGHVFVYDEDPHMLPAFKDIIASRMLNTFGTNNIYKLIKYAENITPKLLFINLYAKSPEEDTIYKNLDTIFNNAKFPIAALLSDQQKVKTNPKIAHYIRLPTDMPKFEDVVESYGLGCKNHQILLLDNYCEKNDCLHEYLREKKYTFFEVHNTDAAEMYLQKNKPKAICVEYNPSFIMAKHTLPHEHIFYVDRHKDITEIENFLH